MLIFSTILTVVLFFTKEVECHNERPTSIIDYIPSFISNFTHSILVQSRKFLDTSSFVTSFTSQAGDQPHAPLLPTDSIDPKAFVSLPNVKQSGQGKREGKRVNHVIPFSSNVTKHSDPFGPLTLDQLRFLLDENEKQLKRAIKKTKWRDKAQQKLITKYTQSRDRAEEDLETSKQLDELSHLQNSLEESDDEKHDAEIFRAIYTSIFYYKKTFVKRFFDRFTSAHRRVKRDEEVVCYKDLGCFRDEGPFDYFDMLPNSPEEINTKFLLHTKENPKREQYLSYTNTSSILSSNFRPNRNTKVIIHGFGSSCHRIWVREMRETFLRMENVNVICVQWEDGASTPNYVRAASNTRLVGAQVAVFLEMTARVTNMSLDDVHLIGFSLGAHVSGYAGQRLKGIGRISGLDPAGPLFESFPPSMRLDASDAKFVDVIHTNADSLLWGGLGAYDPMGHVDFYPNGGRVQKGCKNLFVGGVSDILWPKEGDGRYLCNHRRGYKYFMESVVPVCTFPAFSCPDYDSFLKGDCFPCKDCGNMGYYADKSPGRGQMYLVTRDTEPFCANQYKMEIWHSGGPPTTDSVSTQGRFDVTFVAQDGKNETIHVTRDSGKKMHAGSRTVMIVVLHVAISAISNLQVQYTSYRGWLSSGFNRWAIDKISIMSASGKIQSFCHRGLTMESGLTMVFPLVPGDCNPRELTLHPLPVPWPGIEYNAQNGAHPLPHPPSNPNQVIGPVYNYNTTGGTHISPHHIHPPPSRSRPPLVKPPKEISPPPSRPFGPSTTFSVIYDHPNTQPNSTNTEVIINDEIENPKVIIENDRKNNVTTEPSFNSSYSPMTEEEYLAWRDAPPPNLHSSTYSEVINDKGTDKLPNVMNTRQPVNIIPAPHLGKVNPSSQNYHDTNNVRKLETVSSKGNNKLNFNNNDKTSHKNTEANTSEFSVNKKDISSRIENDESNKSFTVTKIRNKLDFDTSSQDSIIREDAQVTDLNRSGYRKYFSKHQLSIAELEYDFPHTAPSVANRDENLEKVNVEKVLDTLSEEYDIRKTNLGNADITMTKKNIAEELPYNSVIDGEVPFKERARAIKFHSPINLNPVKDEMKIKIKDKDSHISNPVPSTSHSKSKEEDHKSQQFSSQRPDIESHNGKTVDHRIQSTKGNSFGVSQPLHNPSNFDNVNSNPFSYEHYSFATPQSFKTFNSKGLHTLPPTILRPPGRNANNEYKSFAPDISFHKTQPPRFSAPLKTTQYSNFYAQHRYYPRPPAEFQHFDNGHENNGEVFSESSFVPLYDGRDPIFVPSESSSSYIHPPVSHRQHYTAFSPPPTKSPKRQFNPLSFFTSFTQQRDGRLKRPLQGLFFPQKEAPNSEPRFPYYVPGLSPSPDLNSAPNAPQFRRFALPTHLRAPPPSHSHHNNQHRPQISRSDMGRSLEIISSPNDEEIIYSTDQSFIRSNRSPNEYNRPTPKLINISTSYSNLPRAFVKASNANFIPIRVTRTHRRMNTRLVRD